MDYLYVPNDCLHLFAEMNEGADKEASEVAGDLDKSK